MYSNSVGVREEVLRSRQEMDANEFDSFFKYFSDDPDVIDGIFSKNVIRFTQPRSLNDPLEFSPTIRFNNIGDNYRWYRLNDLILPSVELFYRVQIIEAMINNYGILSLTKKPDVFNMWSQYSNGHNGFVLEFNQEFYKNMPPVSNKNIPRPIKYVDDYSINLDEIVDSEGLIRIETIFDKLFFEKTSRWKSENEYRIVRNLNECPDFNPPDTDLVYTDTKVYLFPFDTKCITGIILGASMSQDKKATILSFSEKHDIPLFQAHILRDIPDRDGSPSSVICLRVADEHKEAVIKSKPQLFCTDTVRLDNKESVEIHSLTDLPYYETHKDIVHKLIRNIRDLNDA